MTISKSLSALVEQDQLRLIHRLPYGKMLFETPDRSRLVKTAGSKRARRLLQQEYKGMTAFADVQLPGLRLPSASLLCDEPDLFALSVTRLNGSPPRSWRAPFVPLHEHLRMAGSDLRLSEILANEQLDASIVDLLLKRHGDPLVATTPSHGDYIFWNLLCTPNDRPGLIDFEYYRPYRVAGYDDLHFKAAPWMYRALRAHLPARFVGAALNRFARSLEAPIKQGLWVDLFLVHWMQIAERLFADRDSKEPRSKFPRLAAAQSLLRQSKA